MCSAASANNYACHLTQVQPRGGAVLLPRPLLLLHEAAREVIGVIRPPVFEAVERTRQAALGVVDVAVRRRPRACIVPQLGQTVKGIVGVMHRAAHPAAGHDHGPLQVLFGLGDDRAF